MKLEDSRYWYLFTVVMTVIAYWINKNNMVDLSLIVVLLGVLVSAIDIKKGSVFFFIMAIAFSDYTFEGIFGEEGSDEGSSLGGIYMASVGGSTLMVYWGVINLALIFLKRGNWAINSLNSNSIFKVFSVILFFSLIGLVFNLNLPANEIAKTVISDIRLFVNTILGFLTILLIVDSRDTLSKFFNIFILAFLVHLFLTIMSSYTISQVRTISNFFSGTESYLLGAAFLFLMISLTSKYSVTGPFSKPYINIFGMLLIVLFLFVVASRGKMLGLAFSVLAYMVYSRKIAYVVSLPLLSLVSIYIVQLINPNFYDYFMWKFTTFNPMEEGGESSKIRYVSLLNILHELSVNPYYFFFGKGLGGYFEDNYVPFGTLLANGGFSPKWIAEGKFYKPHGIILYSLLKYGVVMSCLIFFTIFRFCFVGLLKIRNYQKDEMWIIAVALLINIPFFFTIMYSSKLQLMFGMMIGFSIASLSYLFKSKIQLNGR